MHQLRIDHIELVGGVRSIELSPGLNVIRGPITTGKTTLVRLIRALLGSVPDNLAPEARSILGIRAALVLEVGQYLVYRPINSSPSAPVEIAEISNSLTKAGQGGRALETLRLPAGPSSFGQLTYNDWLLDKLGLPNVSVPVAPSRLDTEFSPVTMNDWLGYCIVPGDEIDSSVFGHTNPFRDSKRRYVFELTYGLFDIGAVRLRLELAKLNSDLADLDSAAAVAARYLADTPFASLDAINAQIKEREVALERSRTLALSIAHDAGQLTDSDDVRRSLLAARAEFADKHQEVVRTEDQIRDLRELRSQLVSQPARLTRAIVAGEWLVDFDFVRCPRCGNSVDGTRASNRHECYLCLQPIDLSDGSDNNLIGEQERVASQIEETDEVIAVREEALQQLTRELQEMEVQVAELSRKLDERTAEFVSARAEQIAAVADTRARLETDLLRLREYLRLLQMKMDVETERKRLAEERTVVLRALEMRSSARESAESNVIGLEERLLEYLERLHVPVVGERLSGRIDRRTYLPIVGGRRFDALSSQGLQVLVNVAHALAHHTVAIDRSLPLPGLLVLDGLSSNVGREGFDQERFNDVYRLIEEVAARYQEQLQIVAVDNDVPAFVEHRVRLTLAQGDRLIAAGEHAGD